MHKILAVDDYAPHTYVLQRAWEKAGFQVTTASTGTEALEKAASIPEVILRDVGLPDVNGFEVCRRLKANPRTAGYSRGVYQRDSRQCRFGCRRGAGGLQRVSFSSR